jgi:glycosyltransferase involved in cell wall biosynthesis
MRILQIHNKYLEKGGEDTVVINERLLLQQNGHEVELCEFDNQDLEGISKLSLFRKTVFNLDSYQKVIAQIESFKPDIVHIHNVFYTASPSVFFALKKKKVPTVMTIHNYRFGCLQGLLYRNDANCQLCLSKKTVFYGIKNKCFKDSYFKSLQLSIVNKANQWALKYQNPVKKYIFLADFNKNLLSPILSAKPEDGIIKSNYVNDFGFSPQSERDDYYLFVGRLNEQKGVKLLIDIFKKNQQKLEIIGAGPLEDYVKEVTAGHPNITYLGFRDNAFIIQKLKQSRGLIVPSLTYEGQPMTILEAFSTGTPVYATNTKNLDTIITHGINGYLFDPQNNEVVFNNLSSLDKPDLYTNARKTYETLYSPESNHQQLVDIYKSVLTKPLQEFETLGGVVI